MTVFLKWPIFFAVSEKMRMCGKAIAERGMNV
jgi:hypothetical protein